MLRPNATRVVVVSRASLSGARPQTHVAAPRVGRHHRRNARLPPLRCAPTSSPLRRRVARERRWDRLGTAANGDVGWPPEMWILSGDSSSTKGLGCLATVRLRSLPPDCCYPGGGIELSHPPDRPTPSVDSSVRWHVGRPRNVGCNRPLNTLSSMPRLALAQPRLIAPGERDMAV